MEINEITCDETEGQGKKVTFATRRKTKEGSRNKYEVVHSGRNFSQGRQKRKFLTVGGFQQCQKQLRNQIVKRQRGSLWISHLQVEGKYFKRKI